jgi:membrane-bound lytic murein transglycosylase A
MSWPRLARLLACAVLCGFATAPVAQIPRGDLAATPPICLPAPECRCPQCPAVPADPPPVPELRGRLVPATLADLPQWADDDHREALAAFIRGCEALQALAAWQAVCAQAAALPDKPSKAQARKFFETQFTPWQAMNADGSDTGMVTGYYEPLLMGSRKPTERFRFPIYAPPQDLLTIELSGALPDLKHKRLRGRVQGSQVVPYLSRAEIDATPAPLAGLELAWVDDPVDLFFLHIQGSGRVQLIEGGMLRVGYADQNGHPFRSLGRHLIRKGELRAEQASMQGIKAWAQRNPKKLKDALNSNPSYVFFKPIANDLVGPIGTLGVPLTDERSIAVDARVIPLGPPVYLSTQYPLSRKPLNRLMVAQDTGGAINGGVRADFYWGFGDEAGQVAGRMKQSGRMWVLLPKGYTPDQVQSAPKP